MDMCYLACAYRTPSGYCGSTGGAATCPHRQKRQTNADRIRNMDDYDLAIFLENVSCKHADTESWLDWLREEVTDG